MKTIKENVILAASCLLIGAIGSYYLSPKKVEEKLVMVEKIVEVKQEQKNVRVVEREEKRPDGTVVRDVVTEDRSLVDSRTDSENAQTYEKATGSGLRTNLQVLGGVDFSRNAAAGESPYIYGAGVSRQLLGPISLGVWGMTNRTGGLSISLTF